MKEICRGSEVKCELELPIAGFMSDEGLEYVIIKQKERDDNISD
jgi:adenine deaminase